MTTHAGAGTLRIHISHPLGRSTKAVRDFVDAMDGLGGGSVAVSHSAGLQLDQHWHARASEVLRSTNWLLLVFGERSLDRDWWLWEAGYFTAINPAVMKRMVCLHHPDLNVPRTLHAWRTIPASVAHADSLLREILDSRSGSSARPLLSSVQGKGIRWLSECLRHCCVPASPEPTIDPAHLIG
ncbi:MAG: hypothetical protein KF805_11715 [Phycisphaeraceae bacterium]|nr:hypothetical protein [Phycisphaeraceae bacterium]